MKRLFLLGARSNKNAIGWEEIDGAADRGKHSNKSS
jgi:hypothetical protein